MIQSDIRRRSEGGGAPIAFLFSGHGAQTFHMARAIHDRCHEFRIEMERLDAEMAARLGHPVLRHLYDDRFRKSDPLDDILVSHPAIFMVEYALGRTLADGCGPPDCVLGASLGELVAACLAGAIALSDALDIVTAQALSLARRGRVGCMLAVLSDESLYARMPEIFDGCEIATRVDSSHFIVGGTIAELAHVEQSLAKCGIEIMRLPVSFPFHTARIDALQADLSHPLSPTLGRPDIPVFSCALNAFVDIYSRDHLWLAVRRPMHIGSALSQLVSKGIGTFVDLGPGSAMAAVLTRAGMRATTRVLRVLTPYGKEFDNFRRTQSALMP